MKIFSFVGSQAGEKSRTARFSDMVAEKLKARAAEQGETVEYERLTGADLHLEFCLSCNSCFFKSACPLDVRDDMPLLKQKMLEADVIFFCSPVYAGSMSATAKAVIDRLSYWTHREELAGKTAAVLVTTSGNHGKETVAEIADTIQYMGVSLAYGGFVNTSARPNLYLEEDMEPVTDQICDAVTECLKDPVKYIVPKQNMTYYYFSRTYHKQKLVSDLIGTEPSLEVRICEERNFMQYKNLQEYVKALIEKKRAGQTEL